MYIGLIDCNNFFVSCERLFRPDLRNKPVLVLSSNDGCVVARSQEVKDLGIPMGIPYFEIKDVCKKHKISLFSSNFPLYRDISARVMKTVKEEFMNCEVYSVDEAFFQAGDDVTLSDLNAVRSRVIQKTGIPVSIGIASTKTLAKVANNMAKKRSGSGENFPGVYILNHDTWSTLQGEVLCSSVWGIGRQTSAKLSQRKIYTVADLLSLDKAFVRQLLGVVGGRLVYELQGVPIYGLHESSGEDQQSYTSSRSFGRFVTDKQHLMSALAYHVAHLAEKLRADQKVASSMTIMVRGSRFGSYSARKGSAQSILSIPTNDLFTLTKEASHLLEDIYDSEIPYKKAGVVMSGILDQNNTPSSLFASPDNSQISLITDTLNQKFGTNRVHLAVLSHKEVWQEKRQNISREYTTKWKEIAVVKAT